MSAIWGAVSFHSTISSDVLDCMSKPYHSRCKIDRYSAVTHNFDTIMCATGCGIQYITKESETECLPIYNSDREILFNADCLIDNREELLSLLGASASEPDGTLMYLAYLKWGIDCVKHFRGLFSMAVYDFQTKALYLASDQLSSRCLYYYRQNDTLYFSTLIDGIRAACPQIPFNELYLKDYLTAPGLMPNISGHETPYEGICKLLPGSYLTITSDNIAQTSYWNPALTDGLTMPSKPEEISKSFFHLYQDCVSDALRTSGKVGLAMSSGLDSATVGVLAATKLADTNEQLMTYTYVPYLKPTLQAGKNNELDETAPVREIQAMYPNMVPRFLNNEGRNCMESLPETLSIMEIPFKAYVNLPNLREIYQNAAADGCKILLTGQCGNSTVSHGYIDDVLYNLWETGHYIKFLKFLNHYSKTVKESRKQALIGCMHYFRHTKQVYNNKKFDYTPTNSFLRPSILDNYPLEQRYIENGLEIFTNIPTSKKYYDATIYKAAIYTYMGELETKMGLHYGLIIRDATKDMRMMQFCRNLPYEYFAWNGIPRWLIRSSFQQFLPSHLLNNWMRYCVQNADYISRIERDMGTLQNDFKRIVAVHTHQTWIDYAQLEEYLNTVITSGNIVDFQVFDDFSYMYIMQLFLSV